MYDFNSQTKNKRVVIAESGSTKTDWKIILENEVLDFKTMGLNPYFVDSEGVFEAVKGFLNPRMGEIQEVVFYGTGITDPEKGNLIAQGIFKALSKEVKFSAYSDIVAAARSLFGDDSGIACILGTGSNSCFWNGSEVAFQVPPLGFWLGDEGSGGHLGKSLILAYLHKELPSDVRKKFDDQFGAKDRLEIIKHAYQEEKPNRYFAAFTPFLHENLGNTFVEELVKQSFRLFVEKYLIKYPQTKTAPIGLVGSVAYYFREPLESVFAEYDLKVSKVVQKPIDALVEYHLI